MTLCSFIAGRSSGLARSSGFMWTTVSMSAAAMTWAMSGLRRSTRTNSTRSRGLSWAPAITRRRSPRHRVYSDDPADRRVGREDARQSSADVSGYPGDQDRPGHGTPWTLPRRDRGWLLLSTPLDAVFLSSLQVLPWPCACGASITEPTGPPGEGCSRTGARAHHRHTAYRRSTVDRSPGDPRGPGVASR